MPKIPKYYVRPDGLHETILRFTLPDGTKKRKAFRGKTDKEVWEKIKAYNHELEEKPQGTLFETAADAWWGLAMTGVGLGIFAILYNKA